MKLVLKITGALCLSAFVWWLSIAASEPQSPLDTDEASASADSVTEVVVESDAVETTEQPTEDETVALIDFDDQTEETQWRTVNDTVMGGISQSVFSVTPTGIGVFRGDLSLENNGGFSSVRRALTDDLTGAEGVMIRVKGDGRRYQLRLKMSNAENAVSYRSEFTADSGDWITLWLPLNEFDPVFRGRLVADAPALVPEAIQEIGILLADEQPGEFKLEIDWIRAG